MQEFISSTSQHDVALVQVGGNIVQATQRLLELLGGLDGVIAGRSIAVLKPNFVAGRPARTGATTNLDLIAAVADAVHAAGAMPVLCESPGTEFDFEATYRILGLDDFCRRHEIGIVREVQKWLEISPPGARRLKRFRVPALLSEACLINLPVLKSHVVSGMSVAMKNLMGLLPREDRRAMHTFGIQQSIVDLNLGIQPSLNIVDASVGQEGDGPLYGRPANLGILLASRDSLAIDLACCDLVHVDPRSIGHLRLAVEQVGERRPRLVGDTYTGREPFALPRVHPLYRFAFWLMYPLDYPFHRLTGQHLCTELYHTGFIGTRPEIRAGSCTRCGICVTTCPLPNVINLTTLEVNPRTCERCLLCVEACPEGAIAVKGMSGAVPGLSVGHAAADSARG